MLLNKFFTFSTKRSKSNLPTNGPPEDLSLSTEMDGTVRGLGLHPHTKKPHVLHLLTNQTTGEADLLTANHHNLLAIEKLLGIK